MPCGLNSDTAQTSQRNGRDSRGKPLPRPIRPFPRHCRGCLPVWHATEHTTPYRTNFHANLLDNRKSANNERLRYGNISTRFDKSYGHFRFCVPPSPYFWGGSARTFNREDVFVSLRVIQVDLPCKLNGTNETGGWVAANRNRSSLLTLTNTSRETCQAKGTRTL